MKLFRYIWNIPSWSPFVSEWQFGDGESSGGGARTEEEAWNQLYHDVRIQRQHGHKVLSIEIVFDKPTPVSEENLPPPAMRDDKNLIALTCPHCHQVVPALRIDMPEFQRQKLLYMRCPNCDKGITKQHIDDAYREYLTE